MEQDELTTAIKLAYAANEEAIQVAGNGSLAWFVTPENMGVLIIESMSSLSGEPDSALAEIDFLASLMPVIVEDLQDTQGLIIDIRNNQGGYDGVSQIIARHFLDSERSLYNKQARLGAGRTDSETYRLMPADTTYIKPTVLLVSGGTVSAAEVFTLMLRELPHVTLVGERTQGALSDVLEKELLSGIKVHLVNEYYTTPSGELFEVSGIPVDIEIPYASLAQRQAWRDEAIETAIGLLLP